MGWAVLPQSFDAGVEGVMNAKEHPTHIILHDFGVSLGDLASSLKELQKELEVSCSHSPQY
jgi:hypothetical protein